MPSPCHAGTTTHTNSPTLQYPTRGQIDPYADEDDYQRWPEEDQEDGDSDGGGDGEEGGAVKQVGRWQGRTSNCSGPGMWGGGGCAC